MQGSHFASMPCAAMQTHVEEASEAKALSGQVPAWYCNSCHAKQIRLDHVACRLQQQQSYRNTYACAKGLTVA